MAITVALVSRFTKLNDDRSLRLKDSVPSREREAIVDVTYDGSQNYVTGGNVVDFSAIRFFKQVYLCDIVTKGGKGFITEFIPGAGDDAALGKIKLYGVDPAAAGGAIIDLPEIPSASTVTQSLVLRVRIRGI